MATESIPTTATITLLDLPDTEYHLRKAVIAEIERDTAGFVVSEQSTGVFFYDSDLGTAFNGFLRAFVDQFEFLKRHETELSPSLQSDLERFRLLVQEPETEAVQIA